MRHRQHVLEHGKPHERSTIIKKLAEKIVQMSQQKFASNVVEKCLAFGDPNERQLLVDEMLCRIRSLCLRETHLVDNSLYKYSRSSLKMLNVSDTKFALGNKLSQVHGNSLVSNDMIPKDHSLYIKGLPLHTLFVAVGRCGRRIQTADSARTTLEEESKQLIRRGQNFQGRNLEPIFEWINNVYKGTMDHYLTLDSYSQD
ncbi:hypothetical protein BC332_23874 [Capsicum chinense]|nr:hypothetical protein BC332_23874 [Capsicum chinense]